VEKKGEKLRVNQDVSHDRFARRMESSAAGGGEGGGANAFYLRAVAQVLCEFLFVAVQNVLFVRGLYPPGVVLCVGYLYASMLTHRRAI
jgi:hypothetical protein